MGVWLRHRTLAARLHFVPVFPRRSLTHFLKIYDIITFMKKLFFLLSFFFLTPLFAKTYSRIICLSPSASEIFFEVQGEKNLIARNDFCTTPEKVLELPSVGGFDGKTLSIEKIVSLKPDLIFASKGMHDFLTEPLKKYQIDVYLENISSVSALKEEILYIGKITGCEKNAQAFVNKIEDKIAVLSKKNLQEPEKTKAVFWEVWNEPLMTVGKHSYISELISLCGGKNIFDSLKADYPMVSSESVIKLNPEIIILQSDSSESYDTIKNRPGWTRINAVKNNRIFKIDSDTTSRPSRILSAIDELYEKIN